MSERVEPNHLVAMPAPRVEPDAMAQYLLNERKRALDRVAEIERMLNLKRTTKCPHCGKRHKESA